MHPNCDPCCFREPDWRSALDLRQGSAAPTAPSKNIPKKGPRNCRSLGFARDDKGEGDASMESGC
jgi:hypothetical protein